MANRKMQKCIAGLLAICLAGTWFAGCGNHAENAKANASQGGSSSQTTMTIDLRDYFSVIPQGKDGEGYIEEYNIGVSSKALVEQLYRQTVGLYDESTLENTLTGYDNHGLRPFTVVLDRRENLSNGDEIHATWKVNERGLRLLQAQVPNVEFVYNDFIYTVEGLEGITTIDIFDPDEYKVTIECSNDGTYNSGEAILSNWRVFIQPIGESAFRQIDVEIDELGHTGYWSNGDQIKITVLSSDEYLLEEFGIKLVQRSGLYTIYWLN